LKISRNFVYRAIKRYKELWGVEDKAWPGRPRYVRIKEAIKTVREWIRRNLLWKQKSLSRELNLLPRSKSHLIRDNLHMRAYWRSKGHFLTPALKVIRQTRTERLLQWHAENGQENILFTDEKIFTIEEQYNRQNDKIYAQISREAKEKVPRAQRGHRPSHVMVWWGVSNQGVTPLHFCKKHVKTGA